ncbi:hypothetical protein OS493_017580 [Desmophyllum pertusum]|uniref:Uncharacterized protein n=1 Tax=Desmophyllum pertusum TaxID=174260 RepID=A0A9W9ZP60_9CNID|nr:hypothetical protein OS493_017580 [Desmophyllum pertusum]
MILVQLTVDEEGQFVGTTKNTPTSMHHTMRDLWKGLVHDGLITQDEFDKTTFVNYYRTVNEFKKPFESVDSPVRKAGLTLVSIENQSGDVSLQGQMAYEWR